MGMNTFNSRHPYVDDSLHKAAHRYFLERGIYFIRRGEIMPKDLGIRLPLEEAVVAAYIGCGMDAE